MANLLKRAAEDPVEAGQRAVDEIKKRLARVDPKIVAQLAAVDRLVAEQRAAFVDDAPSAQPTEQLIHARATLTGLQEAKTMLLADLAAASGSLNELKVQAERNRHANNIDTALEHQARAQQAFETAARELFAAIRAVNAALPNDHRLVDAANTVTILEGYVGGGMRQLAADRREAAAVASALRRPEPVRHEPAVVVPADPRHGQPVAGRVYRGHNG